MKKAVFIVFTVFTALLISLTMSGCGTTAKFVYPAQMDKLIRLSSTPCYPQNVAVIPFDDYRNSRNLTTPLFLAYLPLFPFGWCDYERPDASRLFVSIENFNFTPSEDLPKAAAVSLRRSNLFNDAYFTFGGEKNNADLILHGEILSTRYQGTLLTYCLSAYGSYFWVLGAPAGISENTLTLKLYLRKKEKIIWEYTFNRTREVWQWLYYRLGHDVLSYSELMQECMNEAIVDLADKLRSNPELLSK